MAPRLLLSAKALLLRILLAAMFATSATAEPFTFVALGDTTYAPPADNQLYDQLIDAINAAHPAFSIHVGDTKGYGDCGRAFQESQLDFFSRFSRPVFYTPGNNEWADCWKANRGSADPTEILALMREVFWSKPESLGRVSLPLVRESDEIPEFAEFRENARWTFGGATFATLNLSGTHNNQELRVEKYWREFVRREQANLAWVKASFAAARRAGQRAVILAFHSNPFDEQLRYDGGPFEAIVKAIDSEAEHFDGQVLIVQGHYHEFIIDRPLTELDLDKPGVTRQNLTRLQVYGWPDMKAVQVSVDVSKPWVFGFEPVYAPQNSVSPNKDSE
jgi:Calcineurin-like phosphoesterase